MMNAIKIWYMNPVDETKLTSLSVATCCNNVYQDLVYESSR